jgi:hypothetical protein
MIVVGSQQRHNNREGSVGVGWGIRSELVRATERVAAAPRTTSGGARYTHLKSINLFLKLNILDSNDDKKFMEEWQDLHNRSSIQQGEEMVAPDSSKERI